MSDNADIDRARRSFVKQANMILIKFRCSRPIVKINLVRAFCLNIFGHELWNLSGNKKSLKNFSVVYHDIIKRCCDVPRFSHNHMICHDFNFLTFDKLMMNSKLNFVLSLHHSNNPFLWNFLDVKDSLRFFTDLNQQLEIFDLLNLDLETCKKCDIKHIFKCIIARRAMAQWDDFLS